MKWANPRTLSDLFPVFASLETGLSIGLAPPNTEPGPPPSSPAPPTGSAAKATSSFRDPRPAPAGPCLGVNSSGSTGLPNLVWRSWSGLRAGVQTAENIRGWTWASPFRPHTFAGVQVALQAWATDGRVFSLAAGWPSTWDLLAFERVDALSCTPTFLDLLLQNEPEPAQKWQPRQVTLGGEVLRPGVGTRLAARFPRTRFTVIYASAEHGVLLKTHRLDGWYESDGFQRRGSEWRVQDGRLELKRGDNWSTTGDQVEVGGELIRIVGRADAVANVAGTKVSLAEVAEVAETVPGVRRAVATAEPSPVTGQVVCLKYALEPGADPGAVLQALQAHLRKHLRKEAWPRRWDLDPVGLGPNAKRGDHGTRDQGLGTEVISDE